MLIQRDNLYESAAINASAKAGTSSGQAIAAFENTAQWQVQEASPTMQTDWTELAYLQLQTGNTAMYVFILAVVLVFLVLAAQYGSWSLPLAVILVVPMCLLCSIAGVQLAHQDINIFTQIGFIVLVGLACKNAILIVEFASGGGSVAQRGDVGRGAIAVAADYDDFIRVHPRRGAVGDRGRRRGGDAADVGNGRVRGDARGDAVRHFPDAGVLLRHSMG